MKNEHSKTPASASADEESWARLYDRIRLIAHRKTEALIAEDLDEPEGFDRGARALRTLMGAAEIARRMKTQDEKDHALDDEKTNRPSITDEELRELYDDLEERIERIAEAENQKSACEGDQTADAGSDEGVEDGRA